MTIPFRLVNYAIRGVTRAMCRVDDEELQKIPLHGPLILAVNHVNFLDAPLIFSHLQPRPVSGLVKIETWDNPLLGFLFTLWKAIPLRRGEADLTAFRQAQAWLTDGKILAIAPEGTRSKTGHLGRGLPGMALIAVKSNCPIQPLVYFGGELVWNNMHRLVRTDFHIRVGSPFRMIPDLDLRNRATRQEAVDQVMYRMSALLPEKYRGAYSDLSKARADLLIESSPTQ